MTWHDGGGATEGCWITDDDQHLGNSHNSSPCGDRLQNAWDVVRIYKFGHLDAELSLDDQALAGVGSLPSQRAMKAFAETLPGLTGEVAEEIPGLAERPCFKVFDRALGPLKPGVWHFYLERRDDAPPVPRHQWVCSPLHIDAVTHDTQDNNFGRLLRFSNTLGRERKWAMPMEMLCADGVPLRAMLLALGVSLDPSAARSPL